jgi:hypothetical protein
MHSIEACNIKITPGEMLLPALPVSIVGLRSARHATVSHRNAAVRVNFPSLRVSPASVPEHVEQAFPAEEKQAAADAID